MKRYKVFGSLNLEDEIELDDDLTDEEVEKEIWEYVNGFLDWNYREVTDNE